MTQLRLKQLLEYDENSGLFYWIKRTSNRIKIGDVAGNISHYGYIEIRIDKKLYKAHRLAWLYVNGIEPNFIDHINHVRDDNRINNLREVTRQENQRNMSIHKDNKSGKMGVHYSRGYDVWVAYIRVNGKRMHIGQSKSKDEAIEMRESAEVKYNYHKNHGASL